MLYLYLGTDRTKTRDAMNAAIGKLGKKFERVHVSDAHSTADLNAALSGGGMFAQARVVILDGIFGNVELRERFMMQLPQLGALEDAVFIIEEKIDAATKRTLGKYTEKIETFDAAKKEKDNAIFSLRYALEKGDKKALWVGIMREFIAEKPPEAVHGFLFWAAKQILMSARTEVQKKRGRTLVAKLAELPHESRRRGFELEYALERFVLTQA